MQIRGSLPVNLKFVIEGEEEVGGENLDHFLKENADRLKADVCVVSDTSQYGDGIPAITYGLRGIIAAEVRLTGPSKDLHSWNLRWQYYKPGKRTGSNVRDTCRR
ncbi:MAG: hypothetical protein R3C20_03855 [Planctomycetaceae bacterium]